MTEKRIAIMQPYFFPYIGYFQLINQVDKFIFYNDVNFINKGWINRNRILVNGEANLFSLPLHKASQNKLINEIQLTADEKWRSRLLKTIELSYKKAPNYDFVFSLIEEVISINTTLISDMAILSVMKTFEYLDSKKVLFECSSSRYNNQQLKGQNRILDICKQEKTTIYINPSGGLELYDRELFEENGIKIYFINTLPFHYHQNSKNSFISNLSILDVLMFNDKNKVCELTNYCELI